MRRQRALQREDPISSKLQHLFFFGPGFIEDTPEAVKRLVAKWDNKQYARKLNKDLNDLVAQIDKAEKDSDEDKFNDLNGIVGRNPGGIQPGLRRRRRQEDDPARALRRRHQAGRSGHASCWQGPQPRIGDLVSDLRNRFPLPAADDDSDEGRAVLLTKEAADKLTADAKRLERKPKACGSAPPAIPASTVPLS